MKLRPRRLCFDLESDGLLNQLTKIHILVIKDVDTNERWVFHRNDTEDNIEEGLVLLNEAAMLIGHNVVGFDMNALWKVYGEKFAPTGVVRDTLVMVRMLFADQKERDFRLFKREMLEGKYIGTHSLAAWGQRLEFPKGDYSDVKKAEAEAQGITDKDEISRYVWREWNQEMEDYAIQDVEVTHALWRRVEQQPWPDFATKLEHAVHDLMERVQANGFPFDVEAGHELETKLRGMHSDLSARAIEHFGEWWTPQKWLKVNKATTYVVVATGEQEKDQPKYRPRAEFGEDMTRMHWGEVMVPKKTMKFKDILKGDKEAGCPYCPVKIVEFNPNSRQMIVNRLEKMYGWEPQEFTEKGSPVVNDDVLRDLAHTIAICDDLAEIFYYKKRLGQLVDGQNGLIGKATEWPQKGDYDRQFMAKLGRYANMNVDGRIHPRFNVGGTVTNRASHSNPNIAQVPRVVFLKLKQWVEAGVLARYHQGEMTYGFEDEKGIFLPNTHLTPLVGPDGKQIIGTPKFNKQGEWIVDDQGAVETKKSLMKGREGDHGWDFRNLFYVPEGWKLMGADQKGIELRALGHYMAAFDKGEYMRLVVESDPHDLHQKVMELDSRDVAKTTIYALIYGAQDYKLGITVDPTLAMYPSKAKALGSEMRRRLMTRIPAFGAVVKSVQSQAKRGYVEALDGRQLFVRAKHSALNTLLQGAAATVAKLWCVNFEQFCEDDGLLHTWDNGDFAMLAWIHDELQIAVKDDDGVMTLCEQNVKDAAIEAGQRLGFRAPVDVDVKFGMRWSETH